MVCKTRAFPAMLHSPACYQVWIRRVLYNTSFQCRLPLEHPSEPLFCGAQFQRSSRKECPSEALVNVRKSLLAMVKITLGILHSTLTQENVTFCPA